LLPLSLLCLSPLSAFLLIRPLPPLPLACPFFLPLGLFFPLASLRSRCLLRPLPPFSATLPSPSASPRCPFFPFPFAASSVSLCLSAVASGPSPLVPPLPSVGPCRLFALSCPARASSSLLVCLVFLALAPCFVFFPFSPSCVRACFPSSALRFPVLLSFSRAYAFPLSSRFRALLPASFVAVPPCSPRFPAAVTGVSLPFSLPCVPPLAAPRGSASRALPPPPPPFAPCLLFLGPSPFASPPLPAAPPPLSPFASSPCLSFFPVSSPLPPSCFRPRFPGGFFALSCPLLSCSLLSPPSLSLSAPFSPVLPPCAAVLLLGPAFFPALPSPPPPPCLPFPSPRLRPGSAPLSCAPSVSGSIPLLAPRRSPALCPPSCCARSPPALALLCSSSLYWCLVRLRLSPATCLRSLPLLLWLASRSLVPFSLSPPPRLWALSFSCLFSFLSCPLPLLGPLRRGPFFSLASLRFRPRFSRPPPSFPRPPLPGLLPPGAPPFLLASLLALLCFCFSLFFFCAPPPPPPLSVPSPCLVLLSGPFFVVLLSPSLCFTVPFSPFFISLVSCFFSRRFFRLFFPFLLPAPPRSPAPCLGFPCSFCSPSFPTPPSLCPASPPPWSLLLPFPVFCLRLLAWLLPFLPLVSSPPTPLGRWLFISVCVLSAWCSFFVRSPCFPFFLRVRSRLPAFLAPWPARPPPRFFTTFRRLSSWFALTRFSPSLPPPPPSFPCPVLLCPRPPPRAASLRLVVFLYLVFFPCPCPSCYALRTPLPFPPAPRPPPAALLAPDFVALAPSPWLPPASRCLLRAPPVGSPFLAPLSPSSPTLPRHSAPSLCPCLPSFPRCLRLCWPSSPPLLPPLVPCPPPFPSSPLHPSRARFLPHALPLPVGSFRPLLSALVLLPPFHPPAFAPLVPSLGLLLRCFFLFPVPLSRPSRPPLPLLVACCPLRVPPRPLFVPSLLVPPFLCPPPFPAASSGPCSPRCRQLAFPPSLRLFFFPRLLRSLRPPPSRLFFSRLPSSRCGSPWPLAVFPPCAPPAPFHFSALSSFALPFFCLLSTPSRLFSPPCLLLLRLLFAPSSLPSLWRSPPPSLSFLPFPFRPAVLHFLPSRSLRVAFSLFFPPLRLALHPLLSGPCGPRSSSAPLTCLSLPPFLPSLPLSFPDPSSPLPSFSAFTGDLCPRRPRSAVSSLSSPPASSLLPLLLFPLRCRVRLPAPGALSCRFRPVRPCRLAPLLWARRPSFVLFSPPGPPLSPAFRRLPGLLFLVFLSSLCRSPVPPPSPRPPPPLTPAPFLFSLHRSPLAFSLSSPSPARHVLSFFPPILPLFSFLLSFLSFLPLFSPALPSFLFPCVSPSSCLALLLPFVGFSVAPPLLLAVCLPLLLVCPFFLPAPPLLAPFPPVRLALRFLRPPFLPSSLFFLSSSFPLALVCSRLTCPRLLLPKRLSPPFFFVLFPAPFYFFAVCSLPLFLSRTLSSLADPPPPACLLWVPSPLASCSSWWAFWFRCASAPALAPRALPLGRCCRPRRPWARPRPPLPGRIPARSFPALAVPTALPSPWPSPRFVAALAGCSYSSSCWAPCWLPRCPPGRCRPFCSLWAVPSPVSFFSPPHVVVL